MFTAGHDPITGLRLRLLANGYEPIPVVGPDAPGKSPGKRPGIKEWQTVPLDTAMVSSWRSGHVRDCTNTGLRTGLLIGVDIDVSVAQLAQDLVDCAVRMLGGTSLRRIGQAPKILICYCVHEASAKMETAEFILPDGSKAQVEILGKGQQFVAYGVHPVTKSEYQWLESGPDIVPLTDVPVVSRDHITAFLAAAKALIREAGGRTIKEIEAEQKLAAAVPAPAHAATEITSRTGDDFFRNVNAAALANIQPWFLRLFPRGYWQGSAATPPGAWRAHSVDLGRNLEEDISVHATAGGHDFGTRTSKTPIDLVIEHGGLATAKDAAFLLCDWLSVDPVSLGWQLRQEARPGRTERREQRGGDGAGPQGEAWPEPVDFLADDDLTGVPELRPEHLPDALYRFVHDIAVRMGVDPASVALMAVVACASVANDAWSIQPKAKDYTWRENPRIWGAIVGDPSILKSPTIRACTRPIDALDIQARQIHAEAMRDYKVALAEWKKDDGSADTEPRPPRLDRYLVESATIEALSEVLRDDAGAKYHAAAGKVLVRQDEMSEFFANLDRYRSGGRGGGDRGAYLRLYNGGRYVVDRIGRGSFACNNWSAGFIGGVQPGPIQQIAREAADDGLLQRFCFCVPARQSRGEDRRPDQDAVDRYDALFPALVTLFPPSAPILEGAPNNRRPKQSVVLHAAAHMHRLAVDDLAEAMMAMPDTSSRLKAAFGKWSGLFARLALTFHLIDIADALARGVQVPVLIVLSEETARRTAAYMRDILLPHLLRADAVMFSTAQTGHARWIAGYILARGSVRVTTRDIVQAYGALRAPEERRTLLDVMESMVTVGWLLPELQKDPTRPPTAWAVNPAVHTVFAARAARERDLREQTRLRIAEVVAISRGR